MYVETGLELIVPMLDIKQDHRRSFDELERVELLLFLNLLDNGISICYPDLGLPISDCVQRYFVNQHVDSLGNGLFYKLTLGSRGLLFEHTYLPDYRIFMFLRHVDHELFCIVAVRIISLLFLENAVNRIYVSLYQLVQPWVELNVREFTTLKAHITLFDKLLSITCEFAEKLEASFQLIQGSEFISN